MKIYRILTLAVIAAISISFFSCSDDDDDFSSSYLPKTIVEHDENNDATYTYTFAYDDSKRITGWEDNEYKYAVTYKDGKVESLKRINKGNESSSTITYKYDGNKITPEFTGDTFSTIASITTNSNDCVTSWVIFDWEEDIYKYSYSGKNQTKYNMQFSYEEYDPMEEKLVEVAVTAEETINYDNKAGAFRNVNTPQWFISMYVNGTFGRMVGNNFSSSKYFAYWDGELNYKSTGTINHTYNKDNYPIKSVETYVREDITENGGKAVSAFLKKGKIGLRDIAVPNDNSNTITYSYTIDYYSK